MYESAKAAPTAAAHQTGSSRREATGPGARRCGAQPSLSKRDYTAATRLLPGPYTQPRPLDPAHRPLDGVDAERTVDVRASRESERAMAPATGRMAESD